MTQKVKIVTFVPENKAQAIRIAMHKAGAGIVGNYTFCSFSNKGVGRFKPQKGSNPTIGEINKMGEVVEERIEMVCDRSKLHRVLDSIKKAHPYEEVPIDIYSLEEI